MGFTQSPKRHADLHQLGIEPRTGHPLDIFTFEDVLLLSLPGYANQAKAIEMLTQQKVLPPARTVLVSSTGYYGLAYGLVHENTPPGSNNRAQRIATTEQAFQHWIGSNGVIIRLGGLYRPGRGPLSALARRGAPLLRPPDKTLALIHYNDAATATIAALQHPSPEKFYLALSPPCPTRQEFYQHACQQLGLPPPVFDTPLGQPPAHYDITRLRRDLLPHPAYPNWHAALKAG